MQIGIDRLKKSIYYITLFWGPWKISMKLHCKHWLAFSLYFWTEFSVCKQIYFAEVQRNILPGQPLGENPSLKSVADRRGSLCVYTGIMKSAFLSASSRPAWCYMYYSNLSRSCAEQLFWWDNDSEHHMLIFYSNFTVSPQICQILQSTLTLELRILFKISNVVRSGCYRLELCWVHARMEE